MIKLKEKKEPVKKKAPKKTVSKKIVKKKPVELEIIKVEKPLNLNEKKAEQKETPKAKVFFNNLLPLLVFSLFTSILAIGVAIYFSRSSHAFIFSGFNDFISVDSGLISTNPRFNAFEGNNVNYINQEDIMVTKYEMGYYVKVNDFTTPVVLVNGVLNTPMSLKDIVNSTAEFDFIEPANSKEGFLDNEAIELIQDNNFYFFINYDTSKENQVVAESIELKLTVQDK